ncbi:uncharacterized protein LOC106012222 [Aplysia californica]|uniref:Uncharacterized protein LOC106012222 n=1 Tax=Aplysia californica TaxID=6500 RepID=A0ABM1A384_APLCA|nr:uncharacterized protein LOC106012222 [Aplysia californica]
MASSRCVHFILSTGSRLALTVCCLLSFVHYATASVPTYYLDDLCTQTIDLGRAKVHSGRLLLRRPEDRLKFLNCYVFIKAPSNKRLTFKFRAFDVKSPQGCNNNHLQIFDDSRLQISISDKLCNSNRVPDRAFVTTSDEAAVWLYKDRYLADQIELIFTAFTFSPCTGGDFQCDNSHCIASELYCNGYDNCGDESDICLLRQGTIVGIIIGVVVVVCIVAIILGIYFYRRQQKIRREREKNFYSDVASVSAFEYKRAVMNDIDLDKRSAISDISSIYSSTLRKNQSVLSRRDHQLRAVGYQSNTGSGASTLERRPVLHPYDSEMASKVHYVVHDGGVNSRPSTLERKINKSNLRRDHSFDGRSKSADLRAPFFFDKDGYYSDTAIGSGGVENGTIYSTPMKKKGSKKSALSRNSSSVKYDNAAFIYDTKDPSWKSSKNKKSGKKKSSKKKKTVKNQGYETPPEDYDITDDGEQVKTSGMITQTSESLKPDITLTSPDSRTQDLVANQDGQHLTTMANTPHESTHINGYANNAEARNKKTILTLTKAYTNHLPTGTQGFQSTTDGNNIQHRYANGGGVVTSSMSKEASRARHRDGSPYQVHTVDLNQVSRQLKEHPEDGADVYDHVVSFRSYPCPVPPADRRLNRSGSSRSTANS